MRAERRGGYGQTNHADGHPAQAGGRFGRIDEICPQSRAVAQFDADAVLYGLHHFRPRAVRLCAAEVRKGNVGIRGQPIAHDI